MAKRTRSEAPYTAGGLKAAIEHLRTAWLELGTTRGEALGGADTEREQIARLALALWERREAILREARLESDDRELREELLPELRAWLARAQG
ncbi:MAG: hypothetical protein DCC71_12135 [Proteobacteria bacterium]|nr:MAG: hypothetical protein DCC71_12135 [Pseudomonadota bacterium]